MVVKQFTKNFSEFVNESAGSSVKGLPVDKFLPLLEEVVAACPNLKEIMYPDDKLGHASGILKASPNAMAELSDLLKKLGDDSTFYVWNVYTKGIAYDELEKRLAAIGGLPNYQDIQLPELITLLKENEDLSSAVTKINIGLTSSHSKDFAKAMGSGEFGKLD